MATTRAKRKPADRADPHSLPDKELLLLDLELFKNWAFTVGSIATVSGMFCFLGTAYSTSIRLTTILLFTRCTPRSHSYCSTASPCH